MRPNFTLNYGLRYDYYTPLTRGGQPDRQVQHRHRRARSEHHAVLPVEEEQLPAARVGDLRRPTRRPCSAAASASSSARARPKIRFSRSRPSASARRSAAVRCSPIRSTPAAIRRTSPPTRTTARISRAPTANDYTLPEKVYQYTASMQQELGRQLAASAAYVGSQGRNLFLRSIANRIVGVQSQRRRGRDPVIREFDIVQRDADGTIAGDPAARTPRSTTRPAAATTATTRCSCR